VSVCPYVSPRRLLISLKFTGWTTGVRFPAGQGRIFFSLRLQLQGEDEGRP